MNPEPTGDNNAHNQKNNGYRQIIIYLNGHGGSFLLAPYALRAISGRSSPLPSASGRKALPKGLRILLRGTILSCNVL